MQLTTLLASIAVLTAALGTPVLAGDGAQDQRRDRQHASDKRAAHWFDHDMQAVRHDATPDAPGYGWRYFTDQRARRAVVISPQQDYYYSHGKGLHWVAAEQSGT